MTHPTTSQRQGDGGRVALVVSSDESRVLRQWSREQIRHEIDEPVTREFDPRNFDVCLFDPMGYERVMTHMSDVIERSSAPAFLLFLPSDAEFVAPGMSWADIQEEFDIQVDDVVTPPVTEIGIAGTIESAISLSRQRMQSDCEAEGPTDCESGGRTQHLEVLDRLLRHNLSNDINVIAGRAEIIKQQATNGLRAHADTIIDKSAELVETADKEREIVQLVRRDEQPVEQDISETAWFVLDDRRSQFPNVTIEQSLDSEANALASPRFNRAIEELVTNSIVHNDADTPKVNLIVTREDDEVAVTIADNGPGIPEHETNALKQRTPPDPLFHGRGLGLWLVYWIVQFSQGTINLANSDQRGATVTIRLPRST